PQKTPIRFEPASGDHSDLAVGEKAVDRVTLRSDTPIDWKTIDLPSSCDCVSARFVDTTDAKRAVVEVEIESDKIEDIDPDVSAKAPDGKILASYGLKVVTRRQP